MLMEERARIQTCHRNFFIALVSVLNCTSYRPNNATKSAMIFIQVSFSTEILAYIITYSYKAYLVTI